MNFGFGNFAIVNNLSVTKLEFDTQIGNVVGIVVICSPFFSVKSFSKNPKYLYIANDMRGLAGIRRKTDSFIVFRPDRNEAQHSLGFLRFKLLPSLLPFRQALRQEGKWPLQLKFYPAEHTGLPSKKALGKWCFQIRCPRVQKELPLTPKEVLLAEIFSPRKVEPLHFILIIIFQLLVRLDRINGRFRDPLTFWFTVA